MKTLQKEQLQNTVNKMVRIVRGNTGASELYRDMLLSLLPNSTYKVNIAYWNYKADRDDFKIILELMISSQTNILWDYEEMVEPYKEELINFQSFE